MNRASGTAVITNVTGGRNRSLRGNSQARPPTSSTTSAALTLRITVIDSSRVSWMNRFMNP